MSRIGEKIREERIKKGLNLKQLARKCGVSPGFIEDVESGKKIISEKLLDQLSKILGQNLNAQMDGDFGEEEKEQEKKDIFRKVEKRISAKNQEKPLGQWAEALAGIVKKIPIYVDLGLEEISEYRSFPVINGKVEGVQPEKLIYIKIPDDLLKGFRIHQGDRALLYLNAECINGSFALVEYDGTRKIRKIKRVGNNQIQLISYYHEPKAITRSMEELKILGRIMRIEIDF